MKTKSRILAALMAFIMIVGMLPISAFAEGEATPPANEAPAQTQETTVPTPEQNTTTLPEPPTTQGNSTEEQSSPTNYTHTLKAEPNEGGTVEGGEPGELPGSSEDKKKDDNGDDSVVPSETQQDPAPELVVSAPPASPMLRSTQPALNAPLQNGGTRSDMDGSFMELQMMINDNSGERILLAKDYLCEDGFDAKGILIDSGKTITIDLGGFKIDGLEKARVFNVLGNLTIIDSTSTGKITGGQADNGGGIYIHEGAEVLIEGGAVTGNRATEDGGGIYVLGKLTMTGGAVDQNAAVNNGGGIYINNGTLNLQSRAQITDNEAANSAGGIWLAPGKTLSVGGAPVVANNSAPMCSNVLIGTYGVIKIESKLDHTARIDVVMQKPDSPLTSNLTSSGSVIVANSVFTYDKAADRLEVRDGELYLKQASVDVTVGDWQALQNAINDEANRGRVIGLGSDIIAGEEDDRLLLEGKSVTIDLNGHKIDRNLHVPNTDGHVFELRDYAGQHSTLHIIDSAGTGRITGGFADRGGAIYIHEGSTCNVKGSAITGNLSTGEGGAVFVGGTLNLTDVLVAQNASKSGGAICVYEQGEATLSDCVIRENRAEDDGGGIYIKEGTLNLQSGAVITENEASNNGGGIYVADGAETVNITGKVLIFNNRLDNDMYLTAGKKITVTGQLDNDTNIGVSLETLAGTFTTGFKTYNGDKAPDAFFKAASGYSIKKDEEGEARVVTSIAGATVTLTQPSFTYEGKAMKSSVIKSVELSGRILSEGTDYTVSCMDIMNTGTVTVTVTGKGGFEDMVRETFEITRRPLTVRADSATKVYDSTALVCEGFSGEGLADGDRIESAATAGSRTDVGSSPNEVSNAKVVNADGENVTDCYNITYISGVLAVTPAQAIITVDSASKVQGEADPTFTGEVEGLIADGDLGKITYRRISNDEAPGTYNGVLSAAYTDNPNYDVTVINGDFTVIPVSVTVTEIKPETTPPTPVTVSYAAKDGSGKTIQSVTWQKGSGKNLDLTFKRSENDHLTYGLFGSLEIGGVTVGSANYSAAEGSLKLSIKPEYLETLADGDHTVKVNFQDGSATVKLTVLAATTQPQKLDERRTTPNTGDESNLALWSSLMFLSVAGMLVVAVAAMRRRKER